MGAAPTHVHKQDSGQIRPECFPVRYGSRVPARRKGGTSGMLRPDSAGIRPELESCPGFRPPKNRNENRNVPPRMSRRLHINARVGGKRRCRYDIICAASVDDHMQARRPHTSELQLIRHLIIVAIVCADAVDILTQVNGDRQLSVIHSYPPPPRRSPWTR